MDLITLADLPELTGSEAKPRSTIVIGRLDRNLRDPRYGKFSISQADVDSWKRNLDGVFGGEVSFDFDHSSDRGSGTKAAAWISNISQTGTADGSLITADAQFTRAGAKAVRNGDYKYTSPTFVENYTDEHGVKHGKALIGGALTNRPVLRKGMPCLSLSKDTIDGVATPAAGTAKAERKRARRAARRLLADRGSARDSRPQMDLSELKTALSLDADADQVTVLAAVAKLAAPANDSSDGNANQGTSAKASKKAKKAKKAKQTLSADGTETVTLAERIAELELKANRGDAAATQLASERFANAWQKALSEGRAAPSQEENLKLVYAKDPDLALKTLDSFVRIVPTRPAGSGEGAGQTGPAPLGMDEERYQLHQEAKQLAARRVTEDSSLDEGEAYALAAIEIEERKFTLENPGI